MPVTGVYTEVIRGQVVPAGGVTIANPLNRVPSLIHISQLTGSGRVTITQANVTATQIPLNGNGIDESTVDLYIEFNHSIPR